MNVKALLLPLAMSISTLSWASPTLPNKSLHFLENVGQITNQHYEPRTDIDFSLKSSGIQVYISSTAMHYQWYKEAPVKVIQGDSIAQQEVYRMDVKLLNANPDAAVIKDDKITFYERYYNERMDGQKAQAFRKITYQNVYPHIDWTLYIRDNKVEYDFTVHPGGKVSDIQLQYLGARSLSVLPCGSLQATTPLGSMTEAAPFSFQQADGQEVASSFLLQGDLLSFEVGTYTGTLIIDPILEWATYFGGTLDESASKKNLTGYGTNTIYLIGNTPSATNIATEGSHQSVIGGGTDGLISKFDADGVLQWCTYYGGSHGSDNVTGVSCDSEGNVYVAGHSQSSAGITTEGAYQEERAGSRDAFLVKFTEDGERLWATYYGGTGSDKAMAVSINQDNEIFLSGFTLSTNGIASTDAYQSSNGGLQDNFIAKFDGEGDFIWGTFYGGNSYEEIFTSTCDSMGNIYVAGYTSSTDGIASTGAHQETMAGLKDGFVAKFSGTGDRLWSTYLGGAENDEIFSICSDGGNVYLTGSTKSNTGIATAGSFKDTLTGITDAMIAKMDTDGSVVWSTYLGTGTSTNGLSIHYLNGGNIFVGGATNSESGIASETAIQTSMNGYEDAYVCEFETNGNYVWGTYYGKLGYEQVLGIHILNHSDLFLSGTTSSLIDFNTDDVHQPIHGGSSWDLFLMKINICTTPTAVFEDIPMSACEGSIITLSVMPSAIATSYNWMIPEGWAGISSTDSIVLTVGSHTDSVAVIAVYACGNSDTAWHTITVYPLPEPVITAAGLVLNTTAAFSTYQWYKNETAIAGATAAFYTISDIEASYKVEVSNEEGCVAISDTYTSSMGIPSEADRNIHIFPNPVSDYLSIQSSYPIHEVVLYDGLGRIVLQSNFDKTIDCRQLPMGTYIVVLRDKLHTIIGTRKIVKL